MANYINAKAFRNEIIESLNQNKLTTNSIIYYTILVKEISKRLRYKCEFDRDDCIQYALEDFLKYWNRFNPNIPNSNAFSFFTQMAKTSMAKEFKRLRKDDIRLGLVSLDKDEGIKNI